MKPWIFILISMQGFSALAPFFQSAKEIQTLVQDPKLYEILGPSEVLLEVIRTENGYKITTQNYQLDVDVHYGSNQRTIGPIPFSFEFNQPEQMK